MQSPWKKICAQLCLKAVGLLLWQFLRRVPKCGCKSSGKNQTWCKAPKSENICAISCKHLFYLLRSYTMTITDAVVVHFQLQCKQHRLFGPHDVHSVTDCPGCSPPFPPTSFGIGSSQAPRSTGHVAQIRDGWMDRHTTTNLVFQDYISF